MSSSQITQNEYENAIRGFDALFSNNLDGATQVFRTSHSSSRSTIDTLCIAPMIYRLG